MSTLVQDARFALRMLRKSPGFTAVTVLTLAIGIGANTALFSVVDSLLLRPLPYPHSDRLITIWSKPPKGYVMNLSPADFLDFRDQNRAFERIAAGTQAEFNVSIRGVADLLPGFRVSSGFLETLEVKPALGRGFAPSDDRPGAPRVAMISHVAWQRRFGGDRSVLGRTVTVDGERCTIVGVTPASFRFVFTPEMWTPLTIDPANASRENHHLFAVGKLKREIPLSLARAEMEGIAGNLARAYPGALKGWSVELVPWHEWFIGPISQHRNVLVLFGAVGFVLLIAAVNVANLLLAKGAVRQRELAVRASLGAGRSRLVSQVLTEGVILALIGGAAGVVLSSWLIGFVAAVVSPGIIDMMPEVALDWRALSFTLVLSLLTGLLFSMAPAWRASKVNLHAELKAGSRGSTGGSSGRRFRDALVIAEVALSLMLLAGAGLMARSLAGMYSADLGFRPGNVLTMRLSMPGTRYADAARVRAFDLQLLEKVRALPGVRAAALATFMPLESLAFPMPFQVASHPVPRAQQPQGWIQSTSDGYFETLGITIRKGRFFTERDNESAPRVAIVNEAFAKRYLAKDEALGQRLLMQESKLSGGSSPIGKFELGGVVPWEIVGVTGNVKDQVGSDEGSPLIYMPLLQWPQPGGALAVRTELDAAGMAAAVRRAVASLDKEVPVTGVRTLREIALNSFAQSRMQAWMVGSFAIVALILAALGIYGVMSYSVAQSTHEMGIRMALGAHPGYLLRMALREGMRVAGIGLGIGLAGSFAFTRAIGSILYQVKPTDPLTYLAVSALLLAVAALATYIPARRAARVDPLVALRWE